jgi:serine/threonine-protein kinase
MYALRKKPEKDGVGQVFLGRYQTLQLLGEGGMGKVYLGRNTEDDSQVVIKVMRPEVAAVPEARHSFQQEMRLMMRFRHPHAVNLIEASVGGDEPCIIMEYVPGVTLDDVLEKQRRLNAVRTGRILGQLCQVLEAAHHAGIIHRDLTPSNLMIMDADTPQERIKVMDFGLARMGTGVHIAFEKLMGHLDSIGGGTPDYICPEQIRGEEVDHRGDLYSVGVMLYRMLSGRLPFESISETQAILQAHLEKEPPRFGYIGVADVPWELEGVVRSCLAKDPGARPQRARELAERFEKAIGVKIYHPEASQPPLLPEEDAEAPEPSPPAEPEVNPKHVVTHFQAWMPERIAVYKLRGFIDSVGGQILESVPGLIRLRLPEERRREPEPNPLLSLFGLGKKLAPPAWYIMELHMKNKVVDKRNLLDINVVITPEDQRLTPRKHFPEKVSRELRAYLMGH